MAVILYIIFLPDYVKNHIGYATYGDIFDFSCQKTVVSSESWKFKARDKAGRTPYLVYCVKGSI